jgi:hypothetical protein
MFTTIRTIPLVNHKLPHRKEKADGKFLTDLEQEQKYGRVKLIVGTATFSCCIDKCY